MKILIITETLYPKPGNNGNLIGKLIPHLTTQHDVEIISVAFGQKEPLPETLYGVPVKWARDSKWDWKRRYLYPTISKVVDRNGYSDALFSMILTDEIKKLDAQNHYDALITMSEPFISALSSLPFASKKKVLYIMDPPALLCGGNDTPYREKMLLKLLQKQNLVLTTPFIRTALKEHNLCDADDKIVTVGFPLVMLNKHQGIETKDERIHLLFCGWLYSDIRSPRYFLDIVSCLDERFEVTFMGRECEKLRERYSIDTRAEIITLPQQSYETALQAMADADILINIGNSVPVHMPSKLLEYINTGKPMVNFYKIPDCPTLHYTQRYPLALNLYEEEKDINRAAQLLKVFCLTQRGKSVDHAWIEQEYADCTPQYIAQRILDFLEK